MGRERRHMRVVGVEGVVRLSWRGGWLAVEEEEDEEGGGGKGDGGRKRESGGDRNRSIRRRRSGGGHGALFAVCGQGSG